MIGDDWRTPTELSDLRRVGIVSLDTETKDDRLSADMGSGWPFRAGHLCGVSVAYRAEGGVCGHYFPIRHPDSQNFDPEQIYQWVRDHIAAGARFVTQNGLYDYGWLRAEAGIRMPPGERLEEIGALATMVDENRFTYSLEALCAWRGLPGKDEALLLQGIETLGLVANKRKKVVPQSHLWQLPARYVGPYAEADAVNTLNLFENLNPILDQEGTRAAYRLECDILPMVLEMRLRGIRVDLDAAEQARVLLLGKRDAALAELSEKIGCAVGMEEIQGRKWLVETFDRLDIEYPRTEKGNPSFTAGKAGWMARHTHWMPPLIATANKYNKAGVDFLQKLIDYTVDGRIHAEINPHRSENNGTKSFRFSYNDPPLQQMPSRDAELAPLIRGVFLPEVGEIWAKPDASQQEFRLVVHYANQHRLPKAAEAVARYRDDPNTDFHVLAATITALDRSAAKAVNFAKIYGAGVKKFALMIDKPLAEAQRIYDRYDRELPFLRRLSDIYTRHARSQGFITLYDGARRHFDRFAPGGKWEKGAGPCSREEAQERLKDSGHPWYRRGPLYRADTHTALNALIQGSAARHTKLWMLACWREGIVPLLQMHDCLDCSVSSREQAELVARLGCEAVQLDVPMRVDLNFGRSWGDATHSWEELQASPTTISASAGPKITVNDTPQPITQTDIDTINAGLKREGVEPIDIGVASESTISPLEDSPSARLTSEIARFAAAISHRATASILESESIPPPTGMPPPRSNGGNGFDNYSAGEERTGRPLEHYVYYNEQGELHQHKTRSSTKKFWQEVRQDGHWIRGAPAVKYLYGIRELLAAPPLEPIWITEGEKDANTLAALKLVAVMNPGGSGKWLHDFTPEQIERWFKGRQTVYVLEDNDAPGRKHVEIVGRSLHHLVACIRVVSFRELPEKGDVTDWIEQGHTKVELLARAAASPIYQPPALQSIYAADVTMTAVDWLWPDRFAIGKLGIIAGLPDEGKGLLISYIAAQITNGGAWPCNEGRARRGRVILFTAEDDPSDTVVPRLAAAGADLTRIVIISMVREAGKDRMFSLQTDLEMLRRKIDEVGDVPLVLIDPISAYLGVGKVDSYRTTDVRAVLGPVVSLAAELKIAVISIMHFNKKIDITNALLRISDSLAYGATARHVYGVINDAENKRKLVVRAKNNLAVNAAAQTTLAFGFSTREVGTDPSNGKVIVAPYVVWEEHYVDVTATEAMQAASENKSPSALDDAKQFLRDIIGAGGGRAPQSEIEEAAAAEKISNATLKRAKKALRVRAEKDRSVKDGKWYWVLPGDED